MSSKTRPFHGLAPLLFSHSYFADALTPATSTQAVSAQAKSMQAKSVRFTSNSPR